MAEDQQEWEWQQELNLRYVAVTRATERLVLLQPDKMHVDYTDAYLERRIAEKRTEYGKSSRIDLRDYSHERPINKRTAPKAQCRIVFQRLQAVMLVALNAHRLKTDCCRKFFQWCMASRYLHIQASYPCHAHRERPCDSGTSKDRGYWQ